jgi:hypothetical protein
MLTTIEQTQAVGRLSSGTSTFSRRPTMTRSACVSRRER